uniref:Uncharacterized protein n=1 Tax=Pyxicephalus adspersus TaxID=30357 RepID=A0AAV3ALS9_PYXAD|nr:TPA: hypothetical protein GDO54_007975 [Pyxicephalus adspersus]
MQPEVWGEPVRKKMYQGERCLRGVSSLLVLSFLDTGFFTLKIQSTRALKVYYFIKWLQQASAWCGLLSNSVVQHKRKYIESCLPNKAKCHSQ